MEARGTTRDGAVNTSMDDAERIIIEYAPSLASPPPRSGRRLSESQNLLPSSPRNLFEYSATTKYTFDRPAAVDDTHYNPHSFPSINGRESPMWSGVPQSLRKTVRRRWLDLLADFVAVMASFPFLALASALLWVDDEQVTPGKDNSLNQLIKAAATLFPLIFSVVVGRAIVKLASWKAERGTSLGLLERLLGSRTVGGSIITAIGLRSITIGSLILVLIWLLSPLGSQSILRILSTADSSIQSSSNVTYINVRQQSYAGQPELNTWLNGLASLFSASLLAPEEVKTSTMDTWGNVKIPLFSNLSNISEDENGWRQISQSDTLLHTSLFGIPVSVGRGNSTFKLESTYMELACSNRSSTVTREPRIFIDQGLISTVGPFIAAQNITSLTPWAIGYLGDDATSLLPNTSVQGLDTLPLNATAIDDILPGLLLYQDYTGSNNVTSIYCVPSQTYVESEITCTSDAAGNTSSSCTVTAQRLSLLPHPPSVITLFSFSEVFKGISSILPVLIPQLNKIDILQNYIYSPLDNSFIQSSLYPIDLSPPGQESRFLDLPLSDFGVRLGQVLNAVLQGTTANCTTYLTSSSKFSSDTTQTLSSTPQNITTNLQSFQPTLTTSSTTSASIQKFSISYTYLSLFLLSTTFLLFAGILSLLLSQITLLPSFYLTHLSSLLRDSRHLPLPSGGVQLSGFTRAREVGGLRVRLGDVGDMEEGFEIGVGARMTVGKIGIGQILSDSKGRGKERECSGGANGVRGMDGGGKLYL